MIIVTLHMKKITTAIFSLILVAYSFVSVSQTFEGTIVYKMVAVLPEGSTIPVEEFNKMYKSIDTMANLYVKGCNYKFVALNNNTKSPVTVNLYLSGPSELYTYMAGQNEYCTVVKNSKDLYKPQVFEHSVDTLTVMGKKCYSMLVVDKLSRTTIYFSDDHKVDPEMYKDNPVWFLGYFYLSGAVPLKIITSANGAVHNVVFTAVEIKQERLKDEVFKLPKFKHLMEPPI